VPETTSEASRATDEDLRLGDLVVIMSEPGPFLIVEIDPDERLVSNRRRLRGDQRATGGSSLTLRTAVSLTFRRTPCCD